MKLLLIPLPRYRFEGVLGGHLEPHLFSTPLRGGIEVVIQMLAFGIAPLSRVLQPDSGIDSQRERLFFAGKPIAEPPVLSPVAIDPKV